MRVLITRPQPQADATASLVGAKGYHPVIAPLSEIIGLETGIEQLRALPFNAQRILVATSGRAVQTLLDAGLQSLVSGARWAVVGQRAGDLLAGVGGQLIAEPAHDVSALIDALPTDQPLVYVCAQDRKPALEGSFGFSSVIPVYQARALGGFDESVSADLQSNGLDGGLIYSARGANLLVEAFQKAGLTDLLAGSRWFCLSRDVAQTFSECAQHSVNGPVPHLLVPDRPRQDALLKLMDQHLSA